MPISRKEWTYINLSNNRFADWTLNELFVNENKPSFFPRDHSDEVSFVRFSNNGKLLATCSKDDCIHIYNVLPHGLQLNLRIKTDSMDPGFITFNPDDSMMICCSSVEQQSNLLGKPSKVYLMLLASFKSDPPPPRKEKKNLIVC